MPCDGAITFSDLTGKLDMLGGACPHKRRREGTLSSANRYIGGETMSRIKLSRLAVRAAFCLLGVGVTGAANATTYTLTELNPVGVSVASNISFAYGVNNAGKVAGHGTIGTPGSGYEATTWKGTTPTALGTLPGGSGANFAFGINETGQVVGGSNGFQVSPYVTSSQATIWYGTTPTALATPPGLIGSQAIGINNIGQIVGVAGTHAIIWNGTTPTDLSAPNGNAGAAFGINKFGQVVGESYPNGIQRATIWNGTTPTDLSTLGGQTSTALGINNAGQVVGGSSINPTGPQNNYAFIWNGTMTALGSLPGTAGSAAYAINNTGQVVGTSSFFVGERHATVWNGTIPTDLNTLLDSSGVGWLLVDAFAINDVGQIVGWGFNPHGQQHAYLLTPSHLCLPQAKPVRILDDDGHPAFIRVDCEDHDRDDGRGDDHDPRRGDDQRR